MTKLLCPHCQALLTSSEVIAAGKAVQCTQCHAPFTVSAADLARGGDGTEECDVHAILVPSCQAAGPRDIAPVELAKSGILELSKTSASRRERPGPLMSTPYLPPPTPKEALQASPFSPPTRPGTRGALLAVVAGLVLLAGGGSWLAWQLLDQDIAPEQAAISLDTLPTPVIPEVVAALKKEEGVPPGPPPPEGAAPEPVKPAPPVATPQPEPKEPLPPVSQPGPPIKLEPIVPRKPPVAAPKPWIALREAEQNRVNAAIDRGARYLRVRQLANGTWIGGPSHSVGYAALTGLTLLECEVSGNDPVIKKAAAFVRANVPNLEQTYDLSLAILFLDRLGDRKDQGLIQRLALRLVAGQSLAGGWTYECPILTAAETTELFNFLRRTRPEAAKLLNPLATARNGKLNDPLARANPGLADPLQNGKPADFRNPFAGTDSPGLQDPLSAARKRQEKKDPALIQPVDDPKPASKKEIASGNELIPGDTKEPPPKTKPGGAPVARNKPPAIRLDQLSPRIRNIRVVQEHFQKGNMPAFFGSRDDNSNSQFAMLALWTARRHDVPTEKVLGLSFRRYQVSQNDEGGWNYQFGGRQTMGAMSGVGLLGLAMGHATSDEGLRAAAQAMAKNVALPAPVLRDPAIHKGLRAFGKYIGDPDPADLRPAMVNLYLLWTVERVAMLYNLNTIADKDWYRWGVHVLLPNQLADGGWFSRQYPGSDMIVDTCFALLFLKRSNLVQDLTESLHLYLAITDSDSGRSKNR